MDQWVSPGGCGWKIPWMITSTTLSISSCRRNRFAVRVLELSSDGHKEQRMTATCSPQVVSGEPQHIVFTIPIFEPLPSQYYIKAVSDRWLGAEAVCIINFQDLILPERHPPHTGIHTQTHGAPHRSVMMLLWALWRRWTCTYSPFSRSYIHWFCSNIYWLIFAFTPTDLSGALWCC